MILKLFPLNVLSFLLEIELRGFSLCLVGGACRDFYHANLLGTDLDFEIRPSLRLEGGVDSWPQYFQNLHLFFKEKKLVYTELPYLITRVHFANFSFEFSSPRLEQDIPDNHTHHHFKAVIDPDLNYSDSFKRRDFTINAIGIELHMSSQKEILIDPYAGIQDLKNKILKNVSQDFFYDSVRFLRLIRFMVKFNDFKVDESLSAQLPLFNLTQMSHFHFIEELFKSRPASFLNKLNEQVIALKLALPAEFLFWSHYQYPEELKTKEDLLVFIYLQNKNEASLVAQFFSMPQKQLKSLDSFYQSYLTIKSLEKMDLMNLLSLPQDQALEHPLLRDFKNLEDKKQWRNILFPLSQNKKKLLIDWDDWNQVTITSEELNSLKKDQRSIYKYYKTIKAKYS
jgi:tRNA nucleotidyltransferase (CCA-adding enzyme)